MVITSSPDLGTLEVKCVIDLTGSSPVINLTNQTTANPNTSPVPPLDTLVWVLNIYSPTGTPIYTSDFDNPWKVGVWTTEQITAAWPRPFNQIEWGNYILEFQVKDSANTVYPLNKSADLCRPSGNTRKSPNAYGVVSLTVEVLCDKASIYLKDNTSKTYQGLVGILASSYLALDYPRDPTGVRPDPFVTTSFTGDALLPFTFNANGYEATCYSIYTYDLGDNVFVMIRYTGQATFPVQCNIDLCPLACAVKGLEDEIKSGKCSDVVAAQNKLNIITPMLLRAFIAKANPTCGIDLPSLIDEIKKIGGFNCDCVNGSTGIGAQSTLIDGLLFSVNNQGGDIVATFSVTGNNVVLNIKDRSYTFGAQGPCLSSSSENILLVPTVGPTNTHVCLQVNIAGLAKEIYDATAGSVALLNQFNDLVIGGSGFVLNVDGKCIISNGACDFTWVLSNITTADASIASMQRNGVYQTINRVFNINTLPALQTYLNTLGLGVFVVTNLGGGNVQIATTNNTFGLGTMVYFDSISASKKLAVLTQDCAGFAPLTPDEIVQAIIDYLCGLTDAQIKTSQAYAICYIDPLTNTKKVAAVDSGTALTDFIIELLARGCNTIDYIMTISQLTCANIQAAFPVSESVMQPNDFLLGSKNGACARIYPVELGTIMFNYGIYNADFMNSLSAAIELNSGGKMCDPFTTFNLSTTENSPFDNKMSLIVTFTHPTAISVNLRYARIDQGGDLNWSIPVNVLIGASPKTFLNVDEGQYIVGITPVYADGRKCTEITKNTTVCGTINSFSTAISGSNLIVTYSATLSSPKVRVVVNYPNGGTFSGIYANGAGISIPLPPGVYGIFSSTIQSVCNEANGWFGQPTAPSLVEVTPATNSSLVNNSSLLLANTSLTVTNVDGSALIVAPISIPISGVIAFYLADGFYSSIVVNTLSASAITASLVTGSGTYAPAGLGFSGVTVSGGIVITFIDSSPV